MSDITAITYRPFTLDLLDHVWQLRLRALRDHPDAFGEPYESAAAQTPAQIYDRAITMWIGGDNRVFIALTWDLVPIGMLGIRRETRPREQHRMGVWGVYVAPEYRGLGVAAKLMELALNHARSLTSVLQVHLTVVSANQRARAAYERHGFQLWGTMPRAEILGDTVLDYDHMVLMLDASSSTTPERDTMINRPTPDQFTDATWEDILPLYETLLAVDLDPAEPAGIEAWLDDWNALSVALSEAASVANVNYSCNTTDPALEAATLRFSSEIGPQAAELAVKLSRKLLDSGYTRPDLETTLRRFRTDRDIFRAENIPLEQELQKLNAAYNRATGGMKVNWRGEDIPIPRLSPFMLDPDRSTREEAWRLQFQPYIDQRDHLATIFDDQREKRQQVARNAGFANYRDYTFESKHRYDYTPADCETFHDSVEATFVPAIARRYERRRDLLGLDTLRPWDTSGDTSGQPPLRPYENVEEWNATSEAIFQQVDPVFGDYFATMRDENLLDLESRAGKRPGGFCTSFPHRKRPFIFMNASGVGSDVRTLLHEAGHAFHGFESSKLPFFAQRYYGSEMAEVASMSMELLSAPYLTKAQGGFYNEADYARARVEHLDGILEIFAWVATIDAFQHWLYTDEAASDRNARDAQWQKTWERFNPGVNWDGLEVERTARWYKQLHIFLYPFYYIEYAIAQLGALQVWRNSLADQAKATADYRAALALGGSAPLPALFERAGARLIFDAAGMQELVDLIEAELASLEAVTA